VRQRQDDLERWLGGDSTELAERARDHPEEVVEQLGIETPLVTGHGAQPQACSGRFHAARGGHLGGRARRARVGGLLGDGPAYLQTGLRTFARTTRTNALGFLMATFQKLNGLELARPQAIPHAPYREA